MRIRVRFRYNRETGEVEEFRVDDTGEEVTGADHDARHERAAADLGRVIERHPAVEELSPGAGAPPALERQDEVPGDTQADGVAESPRPERLQNG